MCEKLDKKKSIEVKFFQHLFSCENARSRNSANIKSLWSKRTFLDPNFFCPSLWYVQQFSLPLRNIWKTMSVSFKNHQRIFHFLVAFQNRILITFSSPTRKIGSYHRIFECTYKFSFFSFPEISVQLVWINVLNFCNVVTSRGLAEWKSFFGGGIEDLWEKGIVQPNWPNV